MKQIITAFLFLVFVGSLYAQDNKSVIENYKNQKKQEKNNYYESVKSNFDEFRQKANEDYAQFMRTRWEEFQSMKGDPVPEIPEPPQPFEREKDLIIQKLPIKYDKVITIPNPTPIPSELPKRPEAPIIPKDLKVPEYTFTSYGTTCKVHLDNELKFKLKDISENTVADAWVHLSEELSEVLLQDLLSLREELALGDWAYYCLLRDFSEQCYGKGTNEAVLIETYMMAQSGYSVRIARKDNHLALLLPFDGTVYNCTYLYFSGVCYYDVASDKGGSYYAFDHSFTDNDRVLSLKMSSTPKFTFKPSTEKTFTSKRYPDMTVTMSENKNLMDFYNDYPKCLWTNYSWAGLSDETKAKLYPMLRNGIKGKSQIEAANRLINFVQTAFAYKTDGEQFGYERSLFADETFFYPYSDCEDRSILFSILVQDLLGLEVVLLHYPDHLATAVHYTEYLDGAYFTMDGKNYYISDPTYIGANVGECMPRYIKSNPEVLKLK